MTLPFTSVVSLHTNPFTCGVAKFGVQLSERLGVPFVATTDEEQWGDHPLLSFKWSEFYSLGVNPEMLRQPYSVFWHDAGTETITKNAAHVFYADPSLGSPGLWCPSLITPRRRPVRLFSFGMAHKLQSDKYQRVKELLDAASIRYHLRVSVGLHEGTSLDGAEKHFDALKDIMGPDNVTILGILSDDAVSEELANCDYVLAFFEKGVRANNTTFHAAVTHGARIITNMDDASPRRPFMRVFDIAQLNDWPNYFGTPYTWDALIEAMRKECDKSKSRIA